LNFGMKEPVSKKTNIKDRLKNTGKRNKWATPRGAEKQFEKSLRRVAHNVAGLIEHHIDGHNLIDAPGMMEALRLYEKTITPWARSVSKKMLDTVSKDAERAFYSVSKSLTSGLRGMLADDAVGRRALELQAEHVSLIKSIPIQAGERVQKLAMEASTGGKRADEVAALLHENVGWCVNKATLIARTETSKANAVITRARAESVGCKSYLWRTMEDDVVRESHQEMEDSGEAYDWAVEPELSDGTSGHPGMFPNCFIGSMEVSLLNGCKNMWRHFYRGPVVTICDAIGNSITATPNHPILTVRGWVDMKDINETDHIVKIVDTVKAIEDNKNKFIATFDEIFHSFATIMGRETSDRKTFNFHGDIPDNNVDQIFCNSFLTDDRVAAIFKSLCEFSFSEPDGAVFDIIRVCRDLHIDGPFITSFFNKVLALQGIKFEHSDDICLASGSTGDVVAFQDSRNGAARTGILKGQTEFALTGKILFNNFRLRQICSFIHAAGGNVFNNDTPSSETLGEAIGMHTQRLCDGFQSGSRFYQSLRVQQKAIANFSGHVYTLESFCGYYTTGSSAIASKNCRCFAEPVLPGDDE